MKHVVLSVIIGWIVSLGIAIAATLSWEWQNTGELSGITFNVYRDGQLIASVPDPERSVDYARVGWETLEVDACTMDACSEKSEPLIIPGRPDGLKTRGN